MRAQWFLSHLSIRGCNFVGGATSVRDLSGGLIYIVRATLGLLRKSKGLASLTQASSETKGTGSPHTRLGDDQGVVSRGYLVQTNSERWRSWLTTVFGVGRLGHGKFKHLFTNGHFPYDFMHPLSDLQSDRPLHSGCFTFYARERSSERDSPARNSFTLLDFAT